MSKIVRVGLILGFLLGMVGLAGCSTKPAAEEEKSMATDDPMGAENSSNPQNDGSVIEEQKEIIEIEKVQLISSELEPNWTLINKEGFTDYTVGTLISAFNVMDYGADPSGTMDNTDLFQAILNKLRTLGGGTMYVPDGMYRLMGKLVIPKGVTIRGDWKKPEKDKPMEGTVLMAYYGLNGTAYDDPFIGMEVGAGVMNVTIWYPEQSPKDIKVYAPTITMGIPGYFGNEYNNVKNVTLVNPYIGVLFSYENGGASPVINGLYGSPIYIGAEVDNIADVGRLEWIDLSPDYWINCGLYERLGVENPFTDSEAASSVKEYIYQNGTGVIMRRNDWSYTCYLSVEGYNKGYCAAATVSSDPGAAPNGNHHQFEFIGCQTGISIEATNDVGIMFDHVIVVQCENGISVGNSTGGVVQVLAAKIEAKNAAIQMSETSSTKLFMKQSMIETGQVLINGGTLDITDSDFLNGKTNAHITIGLAGRGNIVGNRFGDMEPKIEQNSLFASNIDHTPVATKKVPEFPEYRPEWKVPASFTLFVATDEPYGAKNDGTITDNTTAIQKALDDASKEGGIVFLPPGKYRVDGSLTIPSGVELRGAMENSSVPHGEGSILEVYGGENNPDADPFLIMEERSGLRGITIDYPNQKYTGTKEVEPDYQPVPYPYTIQGRGSDIYIINVGLRAAYQGIDLSTYRCDNHYVDYVTGHVFNTGVTVGGNCNNGKISNLQFNVIVYACGSEAKFGSFANSPQGVSNKPLYQHAAEHLEFLTLGDCTGEILYNNFNYGSDKGIILTTEGNGGPMDGISLGLGLDADRKGLYLSKGLATSSFDFINTQIVSLGDSATTYLYSEGNNSFDITLFNSDYWGNPGNGIVFMENSGTLCLQSANFLHPGQNMFALLKGGLLSIENSAINSTGHLVNNSEGGSKYLSIQSSVVTPQDIDMNTSIWKNNLVNELIISGNDGIKGTLDRSGWVASASENNQNAKNAIDSNINTRWDTGKSQSPGQWFVVDFQKPVTFDCIILDIGSSQGDAAESYNIYVSQDGNTWGDPVINGKKGKGIILLPEQTTRYLKMEQTGQLGNYWSIHEFYLYKNE
ncbi:MAG: hypothetical protein K0S47_217 [Herbinix sp.]|jgi:hypothetical protein|nr:hypothetical protein [Herbinix sp.]